jgi:metal-sulfur cluster biosynthetic enzyme
MTTTTPGCPAAGYLTDAVRASAESVEGVHAVNVELTYEPEWIPEMAMPEVQARFGD